MALEAAAQCIPTTQIQCSDLEVTDLVVTTPVVLTEEELEMTITMRPGKESTDTSLCHDFVIRSWSKTKGWTEHCTGEVAIVSGELNEVDGERVRQLRQRKLKCKSAAVMEASARPVSTEQMYRELSKINVIYGATFQGLQNCYAFHGGSTASMAQTDTKADMPHHAETN
jgi:hypothetical protein